MSSRVALSRSPGINIDKAMHNQHGKPANQVLKLGVKLGLPPPPPLCDISSGCCFFTGLWIVTRSSLSMLRQVAAF